MLSHILFDHHENFMTYLIPFCGRGTKTLRSCMSEVNRVNQQMFIGRYYVSGML